MSGNLRHPRAVDLHGLGRWDAVETVEEALLKRSAASICVITGRGRHSPCQKPVIKPLVDAYLQRNGYWARWHSKGGACTVDLEPGSSDD